MGFIPSPMTVTSTSFDNGSKIPEKFTRDGGDVSPQLSWSNAPADATSFAIICHDPDAPLITPGKYGFVHWVLYGLPGNLTSIDENYSGGIKGVNDFGDPGYGGPQPPAGHGPHHYFFSVIALKDAPELTPGLSLWELLDAIEPSAIAMNRYVGTFAQS